MLKPMTWFWEPNPIKETLVSHMTSTTTLEEGLTHVRVRVRLRFAAVGNSGEQCVGSRHSRWGAHLRRVHN